MSPKLNMLSNLLLLTLSLKLSCNVVNGQIQETPISFISPPTLKEYYGDDFTEPPPRIILKSLFERLNEKRDRAEKTISEITLRDEDSNAVNIKFKPRNLSPSDQLIWNFILESLTNSIKNVINNGKFGILIDYKYGFSLLNEKEMQE